MGRQTIDIDKKMSENSKILLLVPGTDATGGITSYFKTLKNNFSFEVEYFIRGARNWPYRKNKIYETLRAIKDFAAFYLKIKKKRYSVIQTSTSLSYLSLIRDGIFIAIARMLNIPVIVFFRGWKKEVEANIENKYLPFFKWIFFSSACAVVLSSQFKNILRKWGYAHPVYIETTVVDQNLIKNLSETYIEDKFKNLTDNINLLFLARIEKSKGIYEAIDSYTILKKRYPQLTLTIAGDGFELKRVKNYINKKTIADVKFLGFVTGERKIEAFKNAHIYVFPTHTEGMPNSLLEATAFGLPVVTRSVGGINDLFENGKNGFITDSKDPEIIANIIEKLLIDKNLMMNMAVDNFHLAKRKFLTNSVVMRLENIYREFI